MDGQKLWSLIKEKEKIILSRFPLLILLIQSRNIIAHEKCNVARASMVDQINLYKDSPRIRSTHKVRNSRLYFAIFKHRPWNWWKVQKKIQVRVNFSLVEWSNSQNNWNFNKQKGTGSLCLWRL
jgi:hypothetical protein